MNFTIFHFFRKNEKTPETLDFTGFSGGVFGVPEVIRTPDLPLRSRASGVCTTCYLWPQTLAISHFFQVSLPTICHHFLLITTPFEGPN